MIVNYAKFNVIDYNKNENNNLDSGSATTDLANVRFDF